MTRKRLLPALDKQSAQPLHRQIETRLRALIQQPEYQDGKLLPDEITLAQQLQVSRNTLRAALSRLVFAGMLERTRKVGTRVAKRGFDHRLNEWHSFRAEMQAQGITVTDFSVELSQQPVCEDAAIALDLEVGASAWLLRRVRGWNGIATMRADSWLHPRLNLTGAEDFNRPLYEVLRLVANAHPARSRERISAELADAKLAKALGVSPNSSVLVRRRTVLDRKGRPIEYNVNWYRGDQYTVSLELAAEHAQE